MPNNNNRWDQFLKKSKKKGSISKEMNNDNDLNFHSMTVGCPVRMGTEVISIQDGGGMLTSSIRRAYGVRTNS